MTFYFTFELREKRSSRISRISCQFIKVSDTTVLHSSVLPDQRIIFWNFFRVDSSKRLARKRRSTEDEIEYEPPVKVQKYVKAKDPIEQIAQTKTTGGKKKSLVPKNQSLSTTKTLENEGLLISKKGLKKPNGKGYSVGNIGEHTITVPSSGSKPQSDDEDVPDLIEVDEFTKLSHPGLSKRVIRDDESLDFLDDGNLAYMSNNCVRGGSWGKGVGKGRGRGQSKTSTIGRKTINAQRKQTER